VVICGKKIHSFFGDLEKKGIWIFFFKIDFAKWKKFATKKFNECCWNQTQFLN
jgi:hypothetical protein